MSKARWAVSCLAAVLALGALPLSAATGSTVETKRYIVVFNATQAADGTFALGGSYVLNHDYASRSCEQQEERSPPISRGRSL